MTKYTLKCMLYTEISLLLYQYTKDDDMPLYGTEMDMKAPETSLMYAGKLKCTRL